MLPIVVSSSVDEAREPRLKIRDREPAEREVPFKIFLIMDESALARGARVFFELTVTASSSGGGLESSPGRKDI